MPCNELSNVKNSCTTKLASAFVLNAYSSVMFSLVSQLVGAESIKRLKCTSNLEELGDSDVIIEAIVESEGIKKTLFSQLDKIAKASAILASNTSSISITRLASATSRPMQVFVIALLVSLQMGSDEY